MPNDLAERLAGPEIMRFGGRKSRLTVRFLHD
jgi:hypothetical protein